MPGGRFGKYGDLKRIEALRRGRKEKARLSRAELRIPGHGKGPHPWGLESASSPAAKTYKTAVVAIPPEDLWAPIQAVRKKYDRHFRRWMPHITLLYPFRPASAFEGLLPRLARACHKVSPFEVQLARFGHFGRSRRNATLYLIPEPSDAFKRLHAALLKVVPDCDDVGRFAGGFTPHLSVGQAPGAQAHSLCLGWQVTWQPLVFTITQVNLIRRDDPPDDIFRQEAALQLGEQ